MINTLKKLAFLIMILFIVAMMIYLMSYRFVHPELTETQLIFKLWWKALLIVPFSIASAWIINEIK